MYVSVYASVLSIVYSTTSLELPSVEQSFSQTWIIRSSQTLKNTSYPFFPSMSATRPLAFQPLGRGCQGGILRAGHQPVEDLNRSRI